MQVAENNHVILGFGRAKEGEAMNQMREIPSLGGEQRGLPGGSAISGALLCAKHHAIYSTYTISLDSPNNLAK